MNLWISYSCFCFSRKFYLMQIMLVIINTTHIHKTLHLPFACFTELIKLIRTVWSKIDFFNDTIIKKRNQVINICKSVLNNGSLNGKNYVWYISTDYFSLHSKYKRNTFHFGYCYKNVDKIYLFWLKCYCRWVLMFFFFRFY